MQGKTNIINEEQKIEETPPESPAVSLPTGENLRTVHSENALRTEKEVEPEPVSSRGLIPEPETPKDDRSSLVNADRTSFSAKVLRVGKQLSNYMSEKGSKIKEGWNEFKEKTSSSWQRTKRRLKAYIGKITDAPEFTQDNEYIQTGYRINHTTCCRLLKSLFSCHNESVNVWTHLCGAILMIVLLIGLVATFPRPFAYGNELVYAF